MDRNQQEMNLKVQQMRKKVKQDLEEVETKARYWKAEYEIRHYTLEAEKLEEEYNEWMKKKAEQRAQLQKDFEAQQIKNAEAGVQIEEVANA
jgi:hypothetical protein